MDLEYLELNKNTLKNYIDCFKNNNNQKSVQKVEWQFFGKDLKNDFTLIAFDKEKQKEAGIYAISTVKFKVEDENVVGSQSLDTITDIDYRGKGMFTSLANKVYKKAIESKLELVYGFPNGNSIHGFTKKLDWFKIAEVPFLIKPLNSSYFTKKIKYLKWLPNIKLSFFDKQLKSENQIIAQDFFPDKVSDLWVLFSKSIKVGVVRDKEYLDWRYLNKPEENYKILNLYNKNNVFQGFIVYCVKNKHNGKIGYIMESIFDPTMPKIGEELLAKAIKEIKKEKADVVLSWCLEHSPNYLTYKKNGFYKLPEKLRPIELHFGARVFRDKYKNLIQNPKSWFLSYSDSDTV